MKFEWKKSGTMDYSFIAQEIEKVIPAIVNEDEDTNLKTVDYMKIIPFLVSTIKEQQKKLKT